MMKKKTVVRKKTEKENSWKMTEKKEDCKENGSKYRASIMGVLK